MSNTSEMFKNKSWSWSLVAITCVIFLYFIIKKIIEIPSKSTQQIIDIDGNTVNWSPAPITDAIANACFDWTPNWSSPETIINEQMQIISLMTDNQLIAIVNDWNLRIKGKRGTNLFWGDNSDKSLTQSISDSGYILNFHGLDYSLLDNLKNRMGRLNLI